MTLKTNILRRNTQIAPILTKIFRKSLEIGEVPPDWRSANVSPVYKKGDVIRLRTIDQSHSHAV